MTEITAQRMVEGQETCKRLLDGLVLGWSCFKLSTKISKWKTYEARYPRMQLRIVTTKIPV